MVTNFIQIEKISGNMNILLPGEKNRSVSHVILEKLEWYN